MNKRRINPDLENRIFKKALTARKKSKGYATFWDWPDKPTKERGIVCDLLDAIEMAGGRHGIVAVRPYTPDLTPDCIGLTGDQQTVAFEVTELVDSVTIVRNKLGQHVWKKWNPNELISTIQEKIASKDAKKFHGGPYSKKVLVIHTDEPLLCHADCSQIIHGQNFGPCRQINESYLLFSPDPARSVCPFLRLEI